MRKPTCWSIVAAMLLAVCACNGVPGYVIQPEEMAQVMADVRMADAVVTINNRDYNRESKELLRQAIYDRHGITQHDFDTSLVWYGHNIGKYQEVTERSIEILEERAALLAKTTREAAMSVAGDSVDIWDAPTAVAITGKSPSQYLTFSFDSDQNWESGDFYTWRTKFVVPPAEATWSITAIYNDGAVESTTGDLMVNNPQSQQISFYTDSTRVATHISGWLRIVLDGDKPAVLDSIALTRGRHDNPIKPARRFQRKIEPRKANEDADTTATVEQTL